MADAGGESGGDRTEAATPRRLQRAREDGNVATSRELSGLIVLGAGSLACWVSFPSAGDQLARVLRNLIGASGTIHVDGTEISQLARRLSSPVAIFLLPILATGFVAIIVSNLLQTGLLLHVKGLTPDFARVSPARGIKRIFGPSNLVEVAKSLLKLAAFGLVIRHLLASNVGSLAYSIGLPVAVIGTRLADLILDTVLMLLTVQFVIAAIDIVWVRVHRSRSLRMSRQDLKDEQKESDGNPQVKARLRALQRSRARQRMMRAVPTATVILTNPTHYAVALSYKQGGKQAPRVVAKGADEVAVRIRELARSHRIPIVNNPPLARTLFKVPLDQEVPREQFQAVATVIAYIWRLNQRQGPAAT
jgi:flagellar biosynthetic protein FlhB